MRCQQCACYKAGSASMNCRKGKCKCKAGFRGTKCTDRDCVMSPWKWHSKCECGPGKTRVRSRHIVVEPHGNGKRCGLQREKVRCGIKCKCAQHEFGPFCENRHCAVGPWSNPCEHLTPDSGCNWGHKSTLDYAIGKEISREVIHGAKGSGRKCPILKIYRDVTCVVKVCRTFREWLRGETGIDPRNHVHLNLNVLKDNLV